tara:strand:- start:3795 stop:4466 length:672 start_codon:yes stop_codon:yes gene_type:complete
MIGDNIFQQSQNAQQTAANTYNQMATQGLDPNAYQQFMNPYIDDVINQTQQDIERQRKMAINQNSANAMRQNAYGGARSALVDSLTNAEYDRNSQNMAAQQRLAGFNAAQNLAQRDMNTRQSGASGLTGLSNQMFGQGQVGLQQQQQAAELAQRQQQMLLDAARNQTLANLGYPRENLSYYSSIFGGLPQFSQQVPERLGLFDFLTAAGSLPFGFDPFSGVSF